MPDPGKFGPRPKSRPGFSAKRHEAKPKTDLLNWAIFIVLLVGLVLLCWMGTYYVFGHPEQPLSYSILKRMQRIEPPRRFIDTAAPRGEFLTGNKLLERYGNLSDRELSKESEKLLRNYIRNFEGSQDSVPYITGRFNILDSFELTSNDFISSGVVALAQDNEAPQLIIEHLFPAEERMVPALHRSLLTGLDIPIHRTTSRAQGDLAAVVHLERIKDGRLKATVVPIHYPSYAATEGAGSFSLEPPRSLNIETGLPVVTGDRLSEADARYASYRRKAGLDTGGEPVAATNELIRVQPATNLAGETAAVPPEAEPPAPEATAEPTPATAEISPTPDPGAAPPAVVGVGELEPEVRPAVPVGSAVAGTPAVSEAVPLKPFAGNSPAPAVANAAAGGWETYSPGRMPRGRLLGVRESSDLADQPVSGERHYLRGDFTVTASGQNRAVLRSSDGQISSTTRVIVEFPSGRRPPGEGSAINRGGDRPFLITDVRRAADGQVNIYVREITTD